MVVLFLFKFFSFCIYPESGVRRQNNASMMDEETDLISNLPDALLVHMLSLLSTKEAGTFKQVLYQRGGENHEPPCVASTSTYMNL